jgi:hypothetical protein
VSIQPNVVAACGERDEYSQEMDSTHIGRTKLARVGRVEKLLFPKRMHITGTEN